MQQVLLKLDEVQTDGDETGTSKEEGASRSRTGGAQDDRQSKIVTIPKHATRSDGVCCEVTTSILPQDSALGVAKWLEGNTEILYQMAIITLGFILYDNFSWAIGVPASIPVVIALTKRAWAVGYGFFRASGKTLLLVFS